MQGPEAEADDWGRFEGGKSGGSGAGGGSSHVSDADAVATDPHEEAGLSDSIAIVDAAGGEDSVPNVGGMRAVGAREGSGGSSGLIGGNGDDGEGEGNGGPGVDGDRFLGLW